MRILNRVIGAGRFGRLLAWLVGTALLMVATVGRAFALPSFARQTGERCAACHVGGNWPLRRAAGENNSLGLIKFMLAGAPYQSCHPQLPQDAMWKMRISRLVRDG